MLYCDLRGHLQILCHCRALKLSHYQLIEYKDMVGWLSITEISRSCLLNADYREVFLLVKSLAIGVLIGDVEGSCSKRDLVRFRFSRRIDLEECGFDNFGGLEILS